MSNSLNLTGFNEESAAKIVRWIGNIKEVNKRDIRSVRKAVEASSHIRNYVCNQFNYSNMAQINLYAAANLGLNYKKCEFSGDHLPVELLEVTPDGPINIELLLRSERSCAYEYNDAMEVVRSEPLYGDRDILNYGANPLDYVDFKCLPTEKITHQNDDASGQEYNGFDPVFLGVELEVEKKENAPRKVERMTVTDLGKDYVILKSDGSIQNGYEIVTAPATLGYHRQAWDKFFNNSAKYLTSYSNSRCGMHVHISRTSFTPLHLGKMIAFYNNYENRNFITTIAQRASTYAKFNEDKYFHIKTKLVSQIKALDETIKKLTLQRLPTKEYELEMIVLKEKLNTSSKDCSAILQNLTSGGERYSAVNLNKQHTVEIRIFRGNVSKVGMMKNIEFVAAVVEFTREATFRTAELTKEEEVERVRKRKENTDYALHFTYFLDWLNKDTTGNYSNLKVWLSTHKITDKFKMPKQTDKTPLDKRIIEEEVRACA